MACFLVPVAEAVVTTVVAKVMEKKEKETEKVKIQVDGKAEEVTKVPLNMYGTAKLCRGSPS